MIALSCNNLCKSYGVDSILEDISFTVNVGDKVGLIGVNGAGKTTLIKILSGLIPLDEGDLFFSKGLTVGYLEQNTQIDFAQSAFDYCEEIYSDVYALEKQMRALEVKMQHDHDRTTLDLYATLQETFEQLNGYSISSKIRGILNGLGFSEHEHSRPINTLSGGQKSRVGIARLLLKQPDILFLDEPTNHLDIDAIKWLEGYLKEYPGTLVLISHDRYFLDQVVNKIFEIQATELEVYNGNYTEFVKQKAQNYASEEKRYAIQQKEIKKQEELIRKYKERGTEKLAKRAKSRENRLSHIDQLERPKLFKSHFKIDIKSGFKSGKDILVAEQLEKSYGDKNVFKDISLEIYKGERIGLIGPNGVGKTTLFRVLLEELSSDAGTMTWGHNVQKGYYDQEQRNLHLEKTILEEIHDDNPKLSLTEVRSLLGAFMFPNDTIEKRIEQLSGGERSRVSLLKLMLSSANVLFLDEPTNHLDIYSKETLEEALLQYDGTLLFISHDRYFLNKLCTKIFELTPDSIKTYWGNYDYYQEKKMEALVPKEEPVVKNKTQQKEALRKEKEVKQALRKAKSDLSNIESGIETLEHELSELELTLCDSSVFSNPERAKEVQQQISTGKERLEALYEQLDELLSQEE